MASQEKSATDDAALVAAGHLGGAFFFWGAIGQANNLVL